MQPAFDNPVFDSQNTFRQLLTAMSEPGTLVTLPQVSANLTLAAGTVSTLLAMTDQDTKVWLDNPTPETEAYLQFHCSAPFCKQPEQAHFAVITEVEKCPALDSFALGTEEYPDQASTVIIETTFTGKTYRLQGPGIETSIEIKLHLPDSLLEQRQQLSELFPRGLDLILIDGSQALALPRTTFVEVV